MMEFEGDRFYRGTQDKQRGKSDLGKNYRGNLDMQKNDYPKFPRFE